MPLYSLDKIKIDGFRGLRHLALDGLGQITVLVGANNSGKTSVLEALSILCNPLEPFEWSLLVRRRDFGGLDEMRIQSLRWCFYQSGLLRDSERMFKGACEMECEGRFPLRRLRVKYRDILGEPANQSRQSREPLSEEPESEVDIAQPQRGAEIIHYPEFAPSENRTLSPIREVAVQIWESGMGFRLVSHDPPRIVTETLTPYSYQVNQIQVRNFSTSLLAHRGEALELVRQFDPDIESIDVLSLRGIRPSIYLIHRRLGPAPLSVFGDALRRVVMLATTVSILRNGVLFIDEIETGIHVGALSRVFAWLASAASKFGVQVVATTHSLEAVDALLAGAQEPAGSFVAFHLDQTSERTRARRFDAELLARLRRERGLDVR